MASKKVKTVKELNVEVDQILVKIKVIEQNLQNVKDLLNSKMKEINSKLEVKTTQPENRSIKCKSCQNLFKTKTELTTHIYENHPKQLKCDMCEFACSEWYEMEKHMLAMHSVNKNFKCNRCEKSFVTEWRLKKHMQMHDKQTKFCHYFNNGKICRFEELGCKFRHADSKECRFMEKCRKKLCEFKHSFKSQSTDEVIEVSDVQLVEVEVRDENATEDKTNKEIIDGDNFESDEFEEAKEMFCDRYCDMIYGYHLHYDDLYKQYFGVDTRNIRERIIPLTKEHSFAYPCKMCEIYSKNTDEHQEHIRRDHGEMEKSLGCVEENCEYKSQSPENLIRHIAVKHNEVIKDRMKEWQQ